MNGVVTQERTETEGSGERYLSLWWLLPGGIAGFILSALLMVVWTSNPAHAGAGTLTLAIVVGILGVTLGEGVVALLARWRGYTVTQGVFIGGVFTAFAVSVFISFLIFMAFVFLYLSFGGLH